MHNGEMNQLNSEIISYDPEPRARASSGADGVALGSNAATVALAGGSAAPHYSEPDMTLIMNSLPSLLWTVPLFTHGNTPAAILQENTTYGTHILHPSLP